MTGSLQVKSGSTGWLVVVVGLNLALLVVLVLQAVPWIWGLVLLTWTNLFLYAARRVKERSFLTGFLAAFFVFLLLRFTMELGFKYKPFNMPFETLEAVSRILLVGMCALFAAYAIARRRYTKIEQKPARPRLAATSDARVRAEHVRGAALIVFYLAMPFAAFALIRNVSFVNSSSYAALYTNDFVAHTSGIESALLQYAHEVALVAFVVYLATLPSFRTARLPVGIWLLYVGSFMFTGRRRDVAVFLLFVLCYAIARNRITPDDPWLRRGKAWLIVLAVPLLIVLFGSLEAWRGVGETGAGANAGTIPEFLYGQGVSVTVLQNVVAHGHLLPEQPYLLEFARTGVIPRLIGLPILEGNSEMRALDGGSLSHSLSWIVLGPNAYLAGLSTGTSFLAEGFVEFGLWGVAVVGAAYGLLLAWLDRAKSDKLLLNVFRLLVAQSILWAPRGSSTGFIQMLLAPSTWLAIASIYLLAAVAAHQIKRHTQPRVRMGRPPVLGRESP